MKYKLFTVGTVLMMLCLAACKDEGLPRTFLIPANFEGVVRVVFDEDCGISPKVENGRQLLQIPKNGILVLNSELTNYNGKDDDFYLIDENGIKTKVNKALSFKERDNSAPAIIFSGAGVSSGTVNSSNSDTKPVSGGASYIDFNLYNKSANEIIKSVSSKKMDSLTNTLVNVCRIKKGN